MIEQGFIDIPDIFPLLKMKDRRECVDIPDMILFLKIKKCSEHSTSDWKIVDYFQHFNFSIVFNSQNGLL